MPQKKNPAIFESIKGYSAESIGNLVSSISSIKGVSYTNTLDRILLEPVSIDTVVGSTKAMAGAVSTLTPSKEVMTEKLKDGFSTMTELADSLVRNQKISFRKAHDIVVDLILKALSKDKKAYQITPMDVTESSQKVLQVSINLSDEELRSAIDPLYNVKVRNILGGPAPDSVKRMINDRWNRIAFHEKRRRERINKIKKAYEILAKAEKKL
jgi:argininosuccinate lyase